MIDASALAMETLEVYGIVYAQLTDPATPGTDRERMAAAANEVVHAAARLRGDEPPLTGRANDQAAADPSDPRSHPSTGEEGNGDA